MSAAADLAADLTALRRALGVSEEMSIEAIVCAVLIIRKEGSEAETLRMKNLREVNALKDELEAARASARQHADLATDLKVRLDACQALLDDERKAKGSTPGPVEYVPARDCKRCGGAGVYEYELQGATVRAPCYHEKRRGR